MILSDYTTSFLAEDRQRELRAEAAENRLARLSREGRRTGREGRQLVAAGERGAGRAAAVPGPVRDRSELCRSIAAGRSSGRSGTVSLHPGPAHR